jgi:cyclopropane fatty-acyl-phospholipid synthase-like methyltransferase
LSAVSTRRPGQPASVADVADYYDRNTARFLLMGSGTPSLHRALWPPGTDSARAAAEHVDRLIADALAGFDLGPTPVVVDFGCGVGGTLFHLAARFPGAVLTGVTVSDRQVQIAARLAEELGLASRCAFVLGDFQALDPATRADVVVAVESSTHSASPEAFLAGAARHLRAGGRLVVVDDFLAEEESTLAASARARVEELRVGWRLPALCTLERLIDSAARHGFSVARADDLTPLIRTGSRWRDRLTAAVSPLFARLRLARLPFYGNVIGGNALQIGLREGFLRYRMVVLRKGP